MIILSSTIVLCAIALAASLLLYVCSKKFAVKTDPRVNDVHECLPKANCGGCGFAGCQSLAQAIVKAADEGGDMPTCPVGGNDVMSKIYALLGVENKAGTGKKRVATLKCAGCDLAPIATYDGLRTCDAMNRCGSGESACGYGCLGCGDCANACDFGGITINPDKHIPEVDPDVCVACGSCVKACPRHLLEIRQVGVKNRMVVVACSNHDRGPIAMKVCG
uniref:4Fe-4S dicluster domain-containing protein n=1 Tax=Prevotella sp. TaxID=59823 RepID=UPI003FF0E0A5